MKAGLECAFYASENTRRTDILALRLASHSGDILRLFGCRILAVYPYALSIKAYFCARHQYRCRLELFFQVAHDVTNGKEGRSDHVFCAFLSMNTAAFVSPESLKKNPQERF